jgi:hypothetical protein
MCMLVSGAREKEREGGPFARDFHVATRTLNVILINFDFNSDEFKGQRKDDKGWMLS